MKKQCILYLHAGASDISGQRPEDGVAGPSDAHPAAPEQSPRTESNVVHAMLAPRQYVSS